jgi:hypothetical protein
MNDAKGRSRERPFCVRRRSDPRLETIVERADDHYDTKVARTALYLSKEAPSASSPAVQHMHIPLRASLAALTVAAVAILGAGAAPAARQRCHASYPDFCIPPGPPDLDCPDITGPKPFRVRHDVPNPDPHRFDRDRDGRGCEPRPPRRS